MKKVAISLKTYSKLLKNFNKLNQQVSNGMKEDIAEFNRLKNKPVSVKRKPRKFSRQNK